MVSCKDFLFFRNNNTKDWFYERYIDKLGLDIFTRGRWFTMKIALNLYLQQEGGLILETGCQRELDDWGDGGSTQIFCEILNMYQCGKLISIDNDIDNLEKAKSFIKDTSRVSFHQSDSVEFLNNFNEKIRLLYLDSFDYPYGSLLEENGGKEDLVGAIQSLSSKSETEIVDLYKDIVTEAQQHCLDELLAAEFLLDKGSIVLIDDNSLPGGGKPRLARQRLLDTGWTLLLDYQQTLWVK